MSSLLIDRYRQGGGVKKLVFGTKGAVGDTDAVGFSVLVATFSMRDTTDADGQLT